ncbi:monooxygenase, partial [Tsukamurella paurometabola]|nr:monooxygenase [Tsukamurella paurometabola]
LLWGSGILADIVTKPSWRRRAVQAYARLSLRAQVPSAMRDDLTPEDEPLCKRQVVSGTYYSALKARNASLVTEGIERIEAGGIRTADGTLHEADLLVLATGFRA